MTAHETHLAPRAKSLLLVAIATCAAAAGTFGFAGVAAEKASAYWVCGPTSVVVRGPHFRCQHGTYRPTIAYIEKLSSNTTYTVYRSSTAGATSISGVEYFSPTSGYFLQSFGCAPGFPNGHNASWNNVTVSYTLAGSC